MVLLLSTQTVSATVVASGGAFLLYQGGDELGVSRVYYIAYS